MSFTSVEQVSKSEDHRHNTPAGEPAATGSRRLDLDPVLVQVIDGLGLHVQAVLHDVRFFERNTSSGKVTT